MIIGEFLLIDKITRCVLKQWHCIIRIGDRIKPDIGYFRVN